MDLVRVMMVVVVVQHLVVMVVKVELGAALEDRLPLTAARADLVVAGWAPMVAPAVARADMAQQDQQVERELQVQPDP
jgi:hypothetical protein